MKYTALCAGPRCMSISDLSEAVKTVRGKTQGAAGTHSPVAPAHRKSAVLLLRGAKSQQKGNGRFRSFPPFPSFLDFVIWREVALYVTAFASNKVDSICRKKTRAFPVFMAFPAIFTYFSRQQPSHRALNVIMGALT